MGTFQVLFDSFGAGLVKPKIWLKDKTGNYDAQEPSPPPPLPTQRLNFAAAPRQKERRLRREEERRPEVTTFLRAYFLAALTRKSLVSPEGSNKASDEVLVSLLQRDWVFPEFMYTVAKDAPVQGDVEMDDVFDMHTDLHIVTCKEKEENGSRQVYMITPRAVYVLLVSNPVTPNVRKSVSNFSPCHQPFENAKDDELPLVVMRKADTLTGHDMNVGHFYDGKTLRVYRKSGRILTVSTAWRADVEIKVGRSERTSPLYRDLVRDSLFIPSGAGDKYGFLLHKTLDYCRAVRKAENRPLVTKDHVVKNMLEEFIPCPSEQTRFLCPAALAYPKDRECDHPGCSPQKFVAFDYCDMSVDPAQFHVQTKYVASRCFTPPYHEENTVFLSSDDLDRFPTEEDALLHAVPTTDDLQDKAANMAHHLPRSVFPGQTDVQTGVLVTGVERLHGLCELFFASIRGNRFLEWSRVTLLGVDDSFRNNVDVGEEYEEKRHTVWRIVPQTTMLLGFDRCQNNYKLTRLALLSNAVLRSSL